jgi:hypothetical protein
MSEVTINPYGTIGSEFSSGLGTIIGAYPSTITAAQLIAEVASIVSGIYYDDPIESIQIQIQAVATNTINSYINGLVPSGKTIFTAKQNRFINMLLNGIECGMPVLSISNSLLDIEDNITKSDLSVEEQIPLLIATMIGETAYTYWTTDVAAGSPVWHNYYQSNVAQNYANIPFWVASAMEGALTGYGANMSGQIDPTTNRSGVQMMSGLIGALTVGAGKVALQWIPRI